MKRKALTTALALVFVLAPPMSALAADGLYKPGLHNLIVSASNATDAFGNCASEQSCYTVAARFIAADRKLSTYLSGHSSQAAARAACRNAYKSMKGRIFAVVRNADDYADGRIPKYVMYGAQVRFVDVARVIYETC